MRLLGFGAAGLAGAGARQAPRPTPETLAAAGRLALDDQAWPSFRLYDGDHLARVALPVGGIGTGTVSLGGRGDLRDWEIMNRPAKGFVPSSGSVAPFLALHVRQPGREPVCRLLEGPVETFEYEGSHGGPSPNLNLPRFRHAVFATAYPFGRVILSDPDVPVEAHLKAFNPLLPTRPDESGLPLAVLTVELRNLTSSPLSAAVALSLPNVVGIDGWETRRDWKGDTIPTGASRNRNERRRGPAVEGLFLSSDGVDPKSPAWGTLALATTAASGVTARTAWVGERWGVPILDFWDDFSADGRLDDRPHEAGMHTPVASLAVSLDVPTSGAAQVTFILAWHFPNRYSWTPKATPPGPDDWVGNHYATRYRDAWEVVEREVPRLPELQQRTSVFVRALTTSSLPAEVVEAALFNLSTLRSQTCFRTADGRFFGWEGTAGRAGCCHGSCTHVWNYEQATPFLFGSLAWSMREVEFAHATSDDGLMSFRVNLPLARGQAFGKAAADGQMGCVMKAYRDWQLSGDDDALKHLWPKVRKAIEFCWIRGGWDADRDGVMEGCQHNTMDVEYYGPNPQMGLWYLGALRAAEEMARHLGEAAFAVTCRDLFERGRRSIDATLFNGEYYEHVVRPPASAADVAPALLVGMGAKDPTRPEFQLASGCLVDQLVGQYMAHVCGLGYLADPAHVQTTLRSILKYNRRASLHAHFNNMRTFALGGESALLMASYPKGRPENPFPYFGEVMTGFEYTAAVGLLQEGLEAEGLQVIRDVRARYDGRKRNPFDEAECGHHYARAMASWAAVLALGGFRYSAVTKRLTLTRRTGTWFWSNGYAWGTAAIGRSGPSYEARLTVRDGTLELVELSLDGAGVARFERPQRLVAGETRRILVPA